MLKTIRIGRDICGGARYYSVLTLAFHTALLFGPLPYNLAITTAQNSHFLIYLLYNFCNFTTELSWVSKGYWREPRFYTFSTQFFLNHRVSLPICRNVYLSRGPSTSPPGRESVEQYRWAVPLSSTVERYRRSVQLSNWCEYESI